LIFQVCFGQGPAQFASRARRASALEAENGQNKVKAKQARNAHVAVMHFSGHVQASLFFFSSKNI
jgi:hypothetical protein